nr:tRNA1(Val) (adenine(37)-N6)-methyltransferase [Paenibacillus turpanensis]
MTHQLKIIQSDEVFAFSLDAVLLARFCSVPARGRVMDLCTGNGVIPLLLSTRTKALIDSVEIQERLADMASRNVEMNGLAEQLNVFHGDLKEIHKQTGTGVYDVVTVNPPYMPVASGDRKANSYIAAARHEVYCTLEDVIACCSRLLKFGGKAAMVHRPSRLIDIITLMRAYRLEPKRIRFIHPKLGAEANMVLVEAAKEGKPELRLLPPFIVHEENGAYTAELQRIFEGKQLHLTDGDQDG